MNNLKELLLFYFLNYAKKELRATEKAATILQDLTLHNCAPKAD